MMVSTKGRYALRVVIDMVQQGGDKNYIPLREIAERQEISAKYLETIVGTLHKNGLVIGLRGKGGGYKLAKDPNEYTVGSILKLTEGTMAPVACLECDTKDYCSRSDECLTLPMWKQLDALIDYYLESITVVDLINGYVGEDLIARSNKND